MMREDMIEELDLPIGVAILKYCHDWGIVVANKSFREMVGIGEADYFNQERLERIVYSRDFSVVLACLEMASIQRKKSQCQFRKRVNNNDMQWFQMDCSFLRMQGTEPLVEIQLMDISAQKEAEADLKIVRKQYQMLEDLTEEIPFNIDVVNWKSLVPARLQKLRGEEEPHEDYYVDFIDGVRQVHPLDQDTYVKAMREASTEEISGNCDLRLNLNRREGAHKYVWHRVYYRSICDDDGRVSRIIGRSYNIDRDKVLQEEIRRDPLTKLLNKTETQSAIQKQILDFPSGKHVLYVIDIDNFKGINDTFGHTFGDTVICDVANAIRDQFRSDDIVGRVGGDEFVVFMKDASEETAIEKAKSLCQIMEREYTGSEMSRKISISVGLSFYGKDGSNYQVLFEKADHAMYRAKTGGKNAFQLAQAKDVGPIRKKKKTLEQRQEINQSDKDFLAFAVSLMTHARDIDGSLNLLINQIGTRYDLEFVAVTENTKEENTLLLTNCFGNGRGYFERRAIQNLVPELDGHDTGEVMVLHSPISLPRGGAYSGKPEEGQTVERIMVAARYEYVAEHTGQIYFIARNNERVFEQNELEMFQELTRTIAIFVSLRYQVNKSKAAVQQLQMKDQLTGLYNYESFKVLGRRTMATADPDRVYALEYLDLNNFGYVNENYGYQVGDNALKVFAMDYMNQPFFKLGCRLYSDFFVMLVSAADREQLEKEIVSQHQRFSNMQNHQYSSNSFGITAGIYVFENLNVDIEQAFENANLAWKKAKGSHKTGVRFFDTTFRTQRQEEQRVIGEFYEALYRADFRMYLQPKFIVGSREVYGAEALARWQKPDGTIWPPGVFIGPIEKIGYITELDFFIFEEVLKTLSRWQHQHKKLCVISTNFSGKHFEGDGTEFLNRIRMIMGKYDVLPQYIEIEITEGVFVKNRDTLQKCMQELRSGGFRVAIDDFGTGYSALSVLTDLPADVVKMDKSFLDRLDSEQNRSMIVQIGKLVQIAGKEIIFEGIETEQQEEFLQKNGFEHGQGYLCNKPIKVGEFESLYWGDPE